MTRSSAPLRSARRRRALAGAVAGVLVGVIVLSAPQPASASGELQSYLSVTSPGTSTGAFTTTLLQSSLPATVRVALNGLPDTGSRPDPEALYRFSLQTPFGPQVQDVGSTGTSGSVGLGRVALVDFPLGATTPCGRFPVRVATRLNLNDDTTPVWDASGTVIVDGCPREFAARNPLVIREAPGPIDFQFAGRYFPNRFSRADSGVPLVSPIQIAVDGTVVDSVPTEDSTEELLVFDRRVPLDLSCGTHAVAASTPELGILSTTTIEVRCPTLTLSRDTFTRPELPEDITASVTGLLGQDEYLVYLDGEVVTADSTTPEGTGATVLTLPGRLDCGLHFVQITQVVTPSSFPTVDPVPPAAGPAAPPTVLPPVEPDPGPIVTLRKAPLTPKAPATTSNALTAPPVLKDLLATAPVTVRCPGAPSLTVTPDLTVDNGHQQPYALSAQGFSDSTPLTVTVGTQTVFVPPGITTPLGEFVGTVALRLPCGPTTFLVRDPAGRAAADVVFQRCPKVVLNPFVIDRRQLPRLTKASGTGFGRAVPVDVLLDGTDIGDATTSNAGTLVFQVPVPKAIGCGGHQVTIRQRTPTPPPAAKAVLLIVCPLDPVLEVAPEVISTGFTARVTGEQLPPGPTRLVWDLGEGVQRPAMGNRLATVLPDGTLSLSVLLMRNEPVGPRTLLALDPDGPDAGAIRAVDAEDTLVVLSSFQPGRRSAGSTIGLLGRR